MKMIFALFCSFSILTNFTKEFSNQHKMNSCYNKDSGVFIDERDSKKYKWVRVGNQVWMAQNLAFNAGSGCSPFRHRRRQAEKKGYLYDWPTAMKVAPKGWHLPTLEEYEQLIKFIGGTNKVNTYKLLVVVDKFGLNFKPNGEYWNDFPKGKGGKYNGGALHPVKRSKFWTSSFGLSEHKDTLFSTFGIRYFEKYSWVSFTGNKLDRYCVRCIKD